MMLSRGFSIWMGAYACACTYKGIKGGKKKKQTTTFDKLPQLIRYPTLILTNSQLSDRTPTPEVINM